ncbi:MAG: hypothetical protein IJZ68_08345 [Bacteroidaceae bacterium]|nr:hypothetical protein [Bacteroidaceae bacterium]
MKKAELIVVVVIGYGIAPFASILTNICPIAGNILLFSCLGVVLWMALREMIRRRSNNVTVEND